SDGVVWAPVSGRSRSCSSIETIASESETIEFFRRGSRILEVELPPLDGGFELWSTTPLLYSVLATSVPQKGDEERGGLPSEEILVTEGSEFAVTVSELELV